MAPRWEVQTIGKVYVALVGLEVAALIGLAIAALAVMRTDDTDYARFTAILSIYVAAGFLYFAFDSILLENVLQFWGSLVVHLTMLIYSVWHYHTQDIGQLWKDMALYICIGLGVMQAIYFIMAPFVQGTFGWRLYKYVGGNITLQRCYRTSSIFFTLLKLDVFLGVFLVILSGFYLLQGLSLYLAIAAMAVTAVWALVGGYAVYHETKGWLFAVFLPFAAVEPAYIAYKIYDITENKQDYADSIVPPFCLAGAIALLVRVMVLMWTFFAMRNFGLGLRNQVFLRQKQQRDVNGEPLTAAYAELKERIDPLCACMNDSAKP